MSMRLLPEIARSLLMARWRQTLVAAIGVSFSITMFIALLSFMTGLNILLDSLMTNRTPHVRLYNEVRPNPDQPIHQTGSDSTHHFISSVKTAMSREDIYNSEAIIQTLKADRRVDGISPRVHTPLFFNEGSTRIAGMLDGIEVQAENRMLHFFDYIVAGEPSELNTVPNSIILGKALAKTLTVDVGDRVYVTTPAGDVFPLKVIGFYQSGINELDKVQSYTSIATAQKLLARPANYYTDIQVHLTNMALAPEAAAEYRSVFGTQAEDIQTANAQFDTGTRIRTLISYVVGITLLIVAGFGIYNILNMMIYEKMDSIAILKATGFSGGDVKTIFLLIASSIGLAGGASGLVFGYFVSTLIDALPFRTEALPTITTYPVNYNPVFYVIGLLFSLLTTWFAGWFPAVKAGKIDPVAIIRGK